MHQSYSQYYADLWRRHWWWRVRHEVVLRELSRVVGPPQSASSPPRILDIGCAGGVAFDDFSQFGEVHGIEPDSQLVDSTPRWRHRVEQTMFDAQYQPQQPFDVILMLDVLEHIEDDQAAASKLLGILKPGGYAILTVPALGWLWSVHDDINLHFRRYHRRPLQQLLTQTGFQVRQLKYLFGWSLPLVYLRTWLSPKNLQEYRVDVPSAPVNALFAGLTRGENSVSNALHLSPPLGSSLLAVVQRPIE
ncbi:MAG: class I SAM-dependent methyltransferase [Planctomycetota bacterium]